MTPLNEILDREAQRISAGPEALDTVLDLRDRRQRRRRIEAIAVVVVLCAALAVAAGLADRFGAVPASPEPGIRHNGEIAVFQEYIADGKADARVVSIDPASPRPTTIPIRGVDIAGSRFTTQPSWSPDGSSLAYLLTHDLWILDLSSGQSRQVAHCGPCSGSVGWSPDGSTLAVADSAIPAINLFDVDTGQASTISTVGFVTSPAWSPDGESLAFISYPGETGHLYTMRRDGSELRSIADDALTGVAWSPDGSTIAYLSEPSLSSGRCSPGGKCPITVRVVDAASAIGGRLARVGECFCLAFTPGVAWSPDGTQLALVVPGFDKERPSGLYIVSADGSRLRLVLAGGWGQPSWRSQG
jgi:Tol biopolymer transport system component